MRKSLCWDSGIVGRRCRESGDGGVGDKGSRDEWEFIAVCASNCGASCLHLL